LPIRRLAVESFPSYSDRSTNGDGESGAGQEQGVEVEPLLLGERRDVLEHLVVGRGGSEDLDLVVPKRQGRTAPDDGGEQDVSVGDELHGAFCATP
jgi:hypothetical protein